jgi:ketosteroid isomerase-like protein
MMNKIDEDKRAVIAAFDAFYVALNNMFVGNVDKMATVWSHADDVVYMGPDNMFRQGWSKINRLWQDQAAIKMGGSVTPQDVHFIVGHDIAVTNNYEIGENFDANGKVVRVSIRVTNVFRKENNQWKMVSHHTDLLPFLSDERY